MKTCPSRTATAETSRPIWSFSGAAAPDFAGALVDPPPLSPLSDPQAARAIAGASVRRRRVRPAFIATNLLSSLDDDHDRRAPCPDR
jgi:hypothetical protein